MTFNVNPEVPRWARRADFPQTQASWWSIRPSIATRVRIGTLGPTAFRRRRPAGLLLKQVSSLALAVLLAGTSPILAQVPTTPEASSVEAPRPEASPASSEQLWHYGAYVDLSYPINFNFPDNHVFRNKATSRRTNEWTPNVGLAYVRKDVSDASRWGMELAVQGGDDTRGQVPAPTPDRDKPMSGADVLRHLSRANVSYLAPVGRGVTFTAGIMNSFIGYDSFYAKDNMNYTRSYLGDNSPYFLMGLSAKTDLTETVGAAFYIVNGYAHLSHANDVPSYGAQVTWKPSGGWTVMQNVYYGPDQQSIELRDYRFFSDSIIEWKTERVTLAASYDFGTEAAAETANRARTFWTGAAAWARWNIQGPWTVAVRPEFYWDRNGRLTGSEQLIKTLTATGEYKLAQGTVLPAMPAMTVRLEYRYDESTGAGGGLFRGASLPGNGPRLVREQHLLLVGLLWTFDK